jgi:hypothetical protein
MRNHRPGTLLGALPGSAANRAAEADTGAGQWWIEVMRHDLVSIVASGPASACEEARA